MNLFRPVILVGLLFLGGCAGLAGLGGALMSTVGGGAVDALQRKIEARAEWRAEDKRIRSIMVQTLVGYATNLMAQGKLGEAIVVFNKALTIHKEGQPLFLIQELREGK